MCLSMSCICSVCRKHVRKNHRKLLCNICKTYIHKSCSDLTNKEFRQKDTHYYWHCNSCNDEICLPFNHIRDENEFLLQLYRLFENDITITVHNGNKYDYLSFDPTKFQTDWEGGDCNSHTSYFTEDQLNQLHKVTKNNLSMLNINIRSLDKNFDGFKDFLHCTNLDFGVIGLVETWLKDKPLDYFKLNGYSFESRNRENKRGGGVCLYIKDNIKYHVRKDLVQINHPANTESVFIEIEKSGSKNIVIGNMYRPPDQDVNEFNEFIDKVLAKATKNQKQVYLMGDFNINLLNEDIHSQTNDFVNVLSSYSFYPSITKPTRITAKSATLIDNIFTNSKVRQTSGIIINDLSDHLPIFISADLDVYRQNNNSHEFMVRHTTDQNMEYFKKELKNVSWDNVCYSDNVNEMYSKFVEM